MKALDRLRILASATVVALMAVIPASSMSTEAEAVRSDSRDEAGTCNSTIQQSAQRELARRDELMYLLAPIKTETDLAAHLADTVDSPIFRLSPTARERFVDSLTFTPDGLGSFYSADLEIELTPVEIYAILSLFGVQNATPLMSDATVESRADDVILSGPGHSSAGPDQPYNSALSGPEKCPWMGYLCQSHGTCYESSGFICTCRC